MRIKNSKGEGDRTASRIVEREVGRLFKRVLGEVYFKSTNLRPDTPSRPAMVPIEKSALLQKGAFWACRLAFKSCS